MAPIRYLLTGLSIACLVAGAAYWLRSDAVQAQGTLAQAPLNNGVSVKPSFIMAIDDSQSMSFERTLVGGIADTRLEWDQVSASFFKNDGSFYSADKDCPLSGAVRDCYLNVFFPVAGGRVFASSPEQVMPPLDSLGFFRSPAYNLAYFNPATTYRPWLKADKSRFPDADPKATKFDGRLTPATNMAYDLTNTDPTVLDSTTRANLAKEFQFFQPKMFIPEGTPYSAAGRCGTLPSTLANEFKLVPKGGVEIPNGGCQFTIWTFRATFFLSPDPSNPSVPAAGQLPDGYGYLTEKIVKVDNAAGPGRPLLKFEIKPENFEPGKYDAAILNFANWHQYHRTRAQALAAALSEAFGDIDQLRVGYSDFAKAMAKTNVTMLDTAVESDRVQLYEHFGKIWSTGAHGTVNRNAVQYIGEQFKDNPKAITNACQRNAGLLFTDGYTNDGTGPTGIGNIDGAAGSPAPFTDTHSDTLADIAMLYYQGSKVPLKTGAEFPAGKVPVSEECLSPTADKRKLDCQTSLHMNFYGVTLGAKGKVYDVNAAATRDPFDTKFSWGVNPRTVDDGTVIDEIWHATLNSRGAFFNAKSPASITAALRNVLSDLPGGSSPSGTIGSSGPRLTAGSLAVQPRYTASKNNVDWFGNLTGYSVAFDPATSQATLQLKWTAEGPLEGAHDSRSIHFGAPAASGGIRPSVKAFTADAFSGDAATAFGQLCSDDLGNGSCKGQWDRLNKPTTAQMIAYLRGDRSLEGDAQGATVRFRKRTTLLGDIVNSDIVVANKGDDYGYRNLVTDGKADPLNYAAYLRSKIASRKDMVFVGANAGMFHAFDGETGKETFAYIPSTALGHMANLLFPYDRSKTSQTFQHRYFVDGLATAGDVYANGWKTTVVASSGAGGKSMFALDVTNSSAPSVMWELNDKVATADNTGTAVGTRIGNMLGRPVIVPVATANGTRWKAIFGNGYNSASKQAALIVVDMQDGDVVAIPVTDAGATGSNGLGNVAVTDRWIGLAMDNTQSAGRDGLGDTVYAGDQQGNLWKFDLRDNSVAFAGKPLFTAKDKSGARQPIMGGLEVSAAGTGTMVYFGTGSFAFNEDPRDQSMQSAYAIADQGQPVAGRAELQQQFIVASANGTRTGSSNIGSIAKRGWYMDLGIDSSQNGNPTAVGERFIGHPMLQNGILFFATYTPKSAGGSANCEVGGANTLYGVDSLSGAAQMQDVRLLSADGAPAGNSTTSAIELANGGTAPITNLTTYLTSGAGPSTDPGGPEKPPTTRCSAVIQAPGAPSLYMPRPCGRQSWRQIR
ncbi:pilus assembly protein [Lysobacter enzymogenes]|uniref:Pilus assembly protein n=1 Tax=Lysobacter enzymogenes TaxID=69 RepID=A0A3N2RIH2_LYSEN|nr:PilC/PilY family type IV pilus protein [Lysobacter enzymogenes]ROU07288.1 pilus assembly protein [Lysobacter enzymogenes]